VVVAAVLFRGAPAVIIVYMLIIPDRRTSINAIANTDLPLTLRFLKGTGGSVDLTSFLARDVETGTVC
jgi:hypothetical protein